MQTCKLLFLQNTVRDQVFSKQKLAKNGVICHGLFHGPQNDEVRAPQLT